MLRKPEDKKEWQKDILPSIEETSDQIIVEVNGEVVAEAVLKEEAPKNMPKKTVAKKTSAKKTTKKPIAKMEV